MKFQMTMVVAALAVSAKADWWRIDTICTWANYCDSEDGRWTTNDNINYHFDGNDGCQWNAVSGVEEFCIDWANKRGHFVVLGRRYCTHMTADYPYASRPDCGTAGACRRSEWYETPCTW